MGREGIEIDRIEEIEICELEYIRYINRDTVLRDKAPKC